MIEEVIITVDKDHNRAHLTLRWRGDAIVEIDLDLPRRRATVRTDEDTVALVRRLANHYPDEIIAGILNRQQRKTAYGHRFTANLVSSLRRNWDIPCFERPATPPDGELLTIAQIASEIGVATSTVHRWVNDGTIAGEQLTPGAPWRIRLTDELRARVAEQAPGWDTSPCSKRCASWAFPDKKRCCNVSSVVRSTLSMSSRGVKKACVSR